MAGGESSRRGLLVQVPLASPRLTNQLDETGRATECSEQTPGARHQFDDSLGANGGHEKAAHKIQSL